MKTFAKEIVAKATNGTIDENSLEFRRMVFGIEVIISELSKFTMYGIIFALLGRFWEYVFAVAVLAPLRVYMGGYHAKTYWGCFAATLSTFFIVLYLPELFTLNIIAIVGITIVGLGAICWLAPVDTANIPIRDLKVRRRSKIRAFVVFSIWGVVSVLLNFSEFTLNLWGNMYIHFNQYHADVASLTMLITTLLLPIGILNERVIASKKSSNI